jgi:predicted nucleotidyltransferase
MKRTAVMRVLTRHQSELREKYGVKSVDLVLRRAVLPELRDEILAEAVDVF